MLKLIQKPWPWYIAGPMIGMMVPTLYFLANKPFGLSSSLRHICLHVSQEMCRFSNTTGERRSGAWVYGYFQARLPR